MFGEDLLEAKETQALIARTKRPYTGQLHTATGERGKQLVEGLTIRDIYDCIVKAFLDASGNETLFEKGRDGEYDENDVYKVPEDIDPIAVVQNACCNIERLMGIFPNVPSLK